MSFAANPAGLTQAVRDHAPRRALVYGLHKETIDNVVTYTESEDMEATLVSRIGNENSDCWFVLYDGETATRARRIRRML
jgi:hypothetical protein